MKQNAFDVRPVKEKHLLMPSEKQHPLLRGAKVEGEKGRADKAYERKNEIVILNPLHTPVINDPRSTKIMILQLQSAYEKREPTVQTDLKLCARLPPVLKAVPDGTHRPRENASEHP